MNAPKLVEYWNHRRRGDFTAVRDIPESVGEFCDFPADLAPSLAGGLRARGIERLYVHQAQSWDLARSGADFVVVTPTASGKTLCYNLPVCQAAIESADCTALYLFPTKALSQDQLHELQAFSRAARLDLAAATFDGDTPADLRARVRKSARAVISNPDMLHAAILPHHTKWARFFEALRFLVIDELHIYRGVFGSHVANVLRRLERICTFYGSRPQILCCSATIANPTELAARLTGREVEVVERNGAPRARKTFLFYNPPLTDPVLGVRASYVSEVRRFAQECVRRSAAVIVFAGSRLNVEVLVRYLKNAFEKPPGPGPRIRGYRGGYLPQMRRRIERELRSGEVQALVCTNALELGVDIGSLDVSLLAGYPGTIASTWQQVGRAGRRKGQSVAVLVARNLPLDQCIVNNPDYFFGRSPEMALVHPDNLSILLQQIRCAAFELPFARGESFGEEDLEAILGHLESTGFVHRSGDCWYWSHEGYPAAAVSLRNISSDNFAVLDSADDNRVLGEVDWDSAPFLIHPQAVYMHDGRQYSVERLDWEGRRAYVLPVRVDYYTQAMSYSRVRVLDVFRQRVEGACLIEQGELSVTTHLPGFKKIRFYSMENVGYGPIRLPDQEMHTTGCWLIPASGLAAELGWSGSRLMQAMAAVSWALHTVACMTLMCDPSDLGRVVAERHGRGPEGGENPVQALTDLNAGAQALPLPFQPAIYLYDRYTGGIGCAERLIELYDVVISRTETLLVHCRCASGCPGCIGPVALSAEAAKDDALRMLRGFQAQVATAAAALPTAVGVVEVGA